MSHNGFLKSNIFIWTYIYKCEMIYERIDENCIEIDDLDAEEYARIRRSSIFSLLFSDLIVKDLIK